MDRVPSAAFGYRPICGGEPRKRSTSASHKLTSALCTSRDCIDIPIANPSRDSGQECRKKTCAPLAHFALFKNDASSESTSARSTGNGQSHARVRWDFVTRVECCQRICPAAFSCTRAGPHPSTRLFRAGGLWATGSAGCTCTGLKTFTDILRDGACTGIPTCTVGHLYGCQQGQFSKMSSNLYVTASM
jgi:hypothetical protein